MTRCHRGVKAGLLAVVGAVAIAGCGDAAGVSPGASSTPTSAVAPAPVAPAPTGPMNVGDAVSPGAKTPKAFRTALSGGRPIVVGFLYGETIDDVVVGKAMRTVQREVTGRGVVFLRYDVSKRGSFGDLPTRLGVTETPTVVVIGRDRRIVNVWTGLIDAPMLRQSVAQAKETSPG